MSDSWQLSFTISQSVLTFMSIESVMPSNHCILCSPLLLLPSIFRSIRVFSNELALHNRWPKYWSFNFRSTSLLCIIKSAQSLQPFFLSSSLAVGGKEGAQTHACWSRISWVVFYLLSTSYSIYYILAFFSSGVRFSGEK